MKKAFVLNAIIALCSLAGSAVHAEDSAARALAEKALEAVPKRSFVATAKLTGDYRGERQLLIKHKIVEQNRSTYIEVTAPENLVGMRFLFRERAGKAPVQYMRYLASKMPVMIARETRAEPFLGSTFAIVDLSEPDIDAFTYEMAGQGAGVAGRTCTKITATPKKPDDEIYGRIVQCIDPLTSLPVRRKYFDKQGHPVKEWSATKVEQIDSQWSVLDHRMKELRDAVESRIEISDIKFGAKIPDEVFTLDYMSR